MYMGINLNAVQKVLAFHFSEKVENGRGVTSKKLNFEGGVPDSGQGQNQHVNLGLPFDIKKRELT